VGTEAMQLTRMTSAILCHVIALFVQNHRTRDCSFRPTASAISPSEGTDIASDRANKDAHSWLGTARPMQMGYILSLWQV